MPALGVGDKGLIPFFLSDWLYELVGGGKESGLCWWMECRKG